MNMTLSQDTEQCWLCDDSFIKRLQAEQKEVTKNNSFVQIDTEQNYVIGVRECIKILGDDKDILQSYLAKTNALSEKYINVKKTNKDSQISIYWQG